MKNNPSSLNADFNKEFRELYSIFLDLEKRSKQYNKERKANPRPATPPPEHQAQADAILKFAKTFVTFSEKYKADADDLTFLPETLALLDPQGLVPVVMNELYSIMNHVLIVEEDVQFLTKLAK